MIPGDNEKNIYKDRYDNGIPIAKEAWELIKLRAEKINVEAIDRFDKAIIK